jgi:hypothetical protein
LKQDSRPNLVGAAMLRLLPAQGKECQRQELVIGGVFAPQQHPSGEALEWLPLAIDRRFPMIRWNLP